MLKHGLASKLKYVTFSDVTHLSPIDATALAGIKVKLK